MTPSGTSNSRNINSRVFLIHCQAMSPILNSPVLKYSLYVTVSLVLNRKTGFKLGNLADLIGFLSLKYFNIWLEQCRF